MRRTTTVGRTLGLGLSLVLFGCGGGPTEPDPTDRILAEGEFPPGVELAPSGRLTGVPTQVGTFPCVFEVQVEDAVRQLSAIMVILAGEEVT